MKTRRWDVVLRVSSGPLASREPVPCRGPRVVVGTAPGSDGLKLPGGRGLAPQHCTIAVYDPHTVWVTPIGDNLVRISPYLDGSWEDIEPVRGRVRLARGNALHLGPTGNRGVTLEFLECRDLGLVGVERVVSDAADMARLDGRPPDAIEARGERPQVREVLSDVLPGGLLGWVVLALLGGSALLAAVAITLVLSNLERVETVTAPTGVELGAFTWTEGDSFTHEGLDEALFEAVILPNLQAMRTHGRGEPSQAGLDRDDPSTWDPKFFYEVEQQARAWGGAGERYWYGRFEDAREPYRKVLRMVREAGLPDVFAAVPFYESNYAADAQSFACAAGWWQFMPHAGARFRDHPRFGPDYDVARCTYRFNPGVSPWTPTLAAPPVGAATPSAATADYLTVGGECALGTCEVDFRTDLTRSTEVALFTLGEALHDPVLADSGAAVQIAIASHHAGYDDLRLAPERLESRWARGKRYNLLPAYERWVRERGDQVPTSHFFGDAMRCDDPAEPTPGCQDYVLSYTQRYPVAVTALHLLLVCYHGQNHGTDELFDVWARHAQPGGFCDALSLDVPTPAMLDGDGGS